jgi:hypothetical protein
MMDINKNNLYKKEIQTHYIYNNNIQINDSIKKTIDYIKQKKQKYNNDDIIKIIKDNYYLTYNVKGTLLKYINTNETNKICEITIKEIVYKIIDIIEQKENKNDIYIKLDCTIKYNINKCTMIRNMLSIINLIVIDNK